MVTLLLFQLSGVPVISDPSNFTAQFEALYPAWMARVMPYAQDLFYALAFLDIAVFGWTLIRRHGNDIQGAILSTANRIVLIGAFLALLLNGSFWMTAIINMFITVGKEGSGVPSIQPSVLLQTGVDICFGLLGQSVVAGVTGNPLIVASMLIAGLAIAFSFLMVAIEFVLTKVQTFLALGMGIFFLGFGGSGWTRNYVERYFAYAVSSGVRLMTNYFIIGAGLVFSKGWLASVKVAPWSFDGVKAAWIVMFSAVLFAVIAWKGSAMAAQLLGGGPNLSHGDVFGAMATAVQMGAAGVMVSSGVGSAAGAAMGASSATTSAAGAATGATAGTAGAAAGSGGTPASKPPSSGNGGGGSGGSKSGGSNGASAYQTASSVAGALRGVGSNGSHQVNPPRTGGFSDN